MVSFLPQICPSTTSQTLYKTEDNVCFSLSKWMMFVFFLSFLLSLLLFGFVCVFFLMPVFSLFPLNALFGMQVLT